MEKKDLGHEKKIKANTTTSNQSVTQSVLYSGIEDQYSIELGF